MIRFLRALVSKPAPKESPLASKRLGIDLATIDGAVIQEKEFPRPQWKVIREWIKAQVADEDQAIAWREAAADWLLKLKAHLAAKYFVAESTNFLLLTSRSPDAGKSILRTSELAVQSLTNWLGAVAEKRGHGKHVVLDFDSIENYYDYVSYFYKEGSVRASGGVFIRRGYQHIALPPSRGVQNTLIHELTHNRLSHLPLPAWLNEGIAVTMERKLSGNKHGLLDRELHRKHQNHWSTATIKDFWSGDSFDDEDGEVVGLSYSLGEILVDLLVQEFPNFMEFVARADYKDAGQAAAAEVFGIDLNDIASAYLGPGDWTSAYTASLQKES